MAKKSGSKRTGVDEIDEVVGRLRREATPAVAKALNLDSAEAVEAALNAAVELAMAARAVLRAMPMPPEARAHVDRAESEALRAARMAVKGFGAASKPSRASGARPVKVDFRQDRSGKATGRRRKGAGRGGDY